jgi:multimeric flavodoxin WrbA
MHKHSAEDIVPKKILGIVGSYRKGGVIDSLVTEVLEGAREQGAETEKIYLIDRHIEFCTNCRCCTQKQGNDPGNCVLDDDMADIISRYLQSDGMVIGAPVNDFNLNAITRRFMERLVCFAYWPWGAGGPKTRAKFRGKKAVLITSSAMPSLIARFATGARHALKTIASIMGAKPVAFITAGFASLEEHPKLSEKAKLKAREAGKKVAA